MFYRPVTCNLMGDQKIGAQRFDDDVRYISLYRSLALMKWNERSWPLAGAGRSVTFGLARRVPDPETQFSDSHSGTRDGVVTRDDIAPNKDLKARNCSGLSGFLRSDTEC